MVRTARFTHDSHQLDGGDFCAGLEPGTTVKVLESREEPLKVRVSVYPTGVDVHGVITEVNPGDIEIVYARPDLPPTIETAARYAMRGAQNAGFTMLTDQFVTGGAVV
jgi:hypothetical protein